MQTCVCVRVCVLDAPVTDRGRARSGTEFMTRLSLYLKYWVARQVAEDPAWRRVRVLLSGHEVPGEGEHKIMSFIRAEKSRDGYNPNTRHCLYGLDADLIMLGLLSHEPHFALLREEVTFGRQKKATCVLVLAAAPLTFIPLHIHIHAHHARTASLTSVCMACLCLCLCRLVGAGCGRAGQAAGRADVLPHASDPLS
jgi:hypothetical protein